MKPISLIIGACIVILLLGAVLGGITLFRSAEYIQPAVITTAGGETTADVVLIQPLFDDTTSYVTITSNVTGDAAIPSSYTAASHTLTISGLLASTSHYLYITFRYNQLTSYWAADIASRAWPLLIAVGLLGCIGAAIYSAYGKND
jgi:hypothetical protein